MTSNMIRIVTHCLQRRILASCILLLYSTVLVADEQVDYLKQIKPVLRERCYACHGVLKQQAGLRLDTVAFAVKGGDSGPAISLENAAASVLIERVISHDDSIRMPPEGEHLSSTQIELLKAWIAQGAKGPANEVAERDPRDHWAFKAPVRPAVPQVADAVWSHNPIDAFIAIEHERKGLQRQVAADKHVWLRRVSLDLSGLPPTRAEQDAFVADVSPSAYEAVVTRLLDSPQYGERWGRHWMDIWRYSDWWGLNVDVRNSQKHMWHWRDWIIESLNADKPYDQMLREMLAADELYPNDLDRLRASGFLARQYFKFNRTTWLDETVEHTAKAMLGLTFNCAKCHDHKYDPIEQADYYRMRSIFEPYQVRTDQLPGEGDAEKGGLPRAFDCHLDAQTFLHIRGDDRNPDKSIKIEPTMPKFLSSVPFTVEPISLPPEAHQPGLRPFVLENHLDAATQKVTAARKAWEDAKARLSAAEIAMAQASSRAAAGISTVVVDNFQSERNEVWEPVNGIWSYTDGKLKQSQEGAAFLALQLKQLPPENFEARLAFQTTGGQASRTVGIGFDAVETHGILAYLSASTGGPKSQVAYKVGGNYVYPADAAQPRKVELNQPNSVTLRVRGSLVNFLVNDELSVAYQLPVSRRLGALQLVTYDATATFTGFALRDLATDIVMIEPSGKAAPPAEMPISLEQVQLSTTIALKSLVALEAEIPAIRARFVAQKAQYLTPQPSNAVDLACEAARCERIAEIAKAEMAASQAELELAKATSDKRLEPETKLANAKIALEAAKIAVETPAETFTPLVGSQKTKESNIETEDERRQPFPKISTGRRTALANWITDPRNPLAARVAVNHLWLRHMGRPLVPTVFDFGRKGTAPTHPELLDWLAIELIDSDWSMKHIHRLIVTSQAYRLSSSNNHVTPETLARDPENQSYWRANPVRMESQIIRDSLLHLAGELDLTRSGPSIPSTDDNSRRRSLYFVHSHNEHQKFLSMFDDASVLDCYRRAESIVPQQALALENSQLAMAMGEKIAEQIAKSNPNATDRDFVRAAFLTVLSVQPTPEEQTFVQDGLTRLTAIAQQANRPNPQAHARTSVVLALLNHNDFVTVR